MFFVAFHHRQKKIINQLETGESSRKSLIINQDSHIKASAESVEDKKMLPSDKQAAENVEILDPEITLEN